MAFPAVNCFQFILHSVATFWVMSFVGIYPGRASEVGLAKLLVVFDFKNLKLESVLLGTMGYR